MPDTRWVVYSVKKDGTLQRLGEARAPHQPAAIRMAAESWPQWADKNRPQYGFHVVIEEN